MNPHELSCQFLVLEGALSLQESKTSPDARIRTGSSGECKGENDAVRENCAVSGRSSIDSFHLHIAADERGRAQRFSEYYQSIGGGPLSQAHITLQARITEFTAFKSHSMPVSYRMSTCSRLVLTKATGTTTGLQLAIMETLKSWCADLIPIRDTGIGRLT